MCKVKAKKKTVAKVGAEELAALIKIGSMMSNLCFNLKQATPGVGCGARGANRLARRPLRPVPSLRLQGGSDFGHLWGVHVRGRLVLTR
jgi:hypothetical protein